MIAVYAVISIFVGISVFKQNYLSGIIVFLLFCYSFFSLLGYALFPEKLKLVSHGQYYGEEYFYPFAMYLIVFMAFVGLFYGVFRSAKGHIVSESVRIKLNYRQSLFYVVIACLIFFPGIMIARNVNLASYYGQSLLKSNKLWSFSYGFLGIICIVLILLVIKEWKENHVINKIYVVLSIVSFGILLLTAIRFGQRIQLFELMTGIIVILLELYAAKIIGVKSKGFAKHVLVIVFICVLFVIVMQIIRDNRGGEIGISNVIPTIQSLVASITTIEYWVFQDWLSPGLSLLTCIRYGIIEPSTVLATDFLNLFSFLTGHSYSVTDSIKIMFDRQTETGYGYFFATEGYQLIGKMGCVLSAFLINVYLWIYKIVFDVKGDAYLKALLNGVVGFYAIAFVRGTSLFFLKGILFYIIPCLVLYALATGKGILIKIEKKG